MATFELEARLNNLLSTTQAETADIDLFAPIPLREECPICMLPLPFDENEIAFMTCCGKNICCGCIDQNTLTDIIKNGLKRNEMKCIFCRRLQSELDNDLKELKKLMKKNEPYAFLMMAARYESGNGVIQSHTKQLNMIICAAEFGNAHAFEYIGDCYRRGTELIKICQKRWNFMKSRQRKDH